MNAMTKRQLAPYTKGVVTSADGTRIGYRQLGSGPGVVLLHGGVNASQHLMRLGSALAGTLTVYIPDRRGRGLSGPIGADYGLRTEDEDLAALLKQTGARNVFGVADGALFALQSALSLPSIEKVAAYEALPSNLLASSPVMPSLVHPWRRSTWWVTRTYVARRSSRPRRTTGSGSRIGRRRCSKRSRFAHRRPQGAR